MAARRERIGGWAHNVCVRRGTGRVHFLVCLQNEEDSRALSEPVRFDSAARSIDMASRLGTAYCASAIAKQ